MAGEIKVAPGIHMELTILNVAGGTLTGIQPGSMEGSGLLTCNAYRQRLVAIAEAFRMFGTLIQKDIKEVHAFVKAAESIDS